MKKAVCLTFVLLAFALFRPSATTAAFLDTTPITVAQFDAMAGTPIVNSLLNSSFFIEGTLAVGHDTVGTVSSAAFTGKGPDAGNLLIFTAKITLDTSTATGDPLGTVAAITYLTDVASFLTTGAISGIQTFFITDSALSGNLQAIYGAMNGAAAPASSETITGSGQLKYVFSDSSNFLICGQPGADPNFCVPAGTGLNVSTKIAAPNSMSAVFGFLASSSAAPYVNVLILDSGKSTTGAQVVAPSTVPEPGTLLLLGSGLTGLAAWARRRRQGN